MKSFHELLETFRRERQISKKTLALLAGLTPGYISLLTRGERTAPSEETVEALANALKLDPAARIEFFMSAGYSTSSRSNETSLPINQSDQRVQEKSTTKVSWDEIPDVEKFYGRQKELATLENWIIDDCCRLVGILGIGGVGKTSLAAKLTGQLKDRFDYVFWRTLQHGPQISHVLKNCIQFLSNQKEIDLPQEVDDQIALLIKWLRTYRCLLVLDNIESVLQGGRRAGQYREGFEGYGKLIQRLGETVHQSCLLLTTREKLKEVAVFEGEASAVRTLSLEGMSQSEVQLILRDKGLFGSNEAWSKLIYLYSGNPLALKLVSAPIRDLFKGNIAEFLDAGGAIVGDVYDLLDQQFQRLSEQEREIMYWLAIESEPMSLQDLYEALVRPTSIVSLLNAVNSVRRRSLIEANGTARFSLQPVIREYVTYRFVEMVSEEIEKEAFRVLESHALIIAQSKDYVRRSQVQFILKPVAERLLNSLGKEKSEEKLRNIIFALQKAGPQTTGYVSGNILNLLVQLKADLRGYDFSDLTVRQAYLQDVALPGVNFARADLAHSVFTETFGSILSVALSPHGGLLAVGTINSEIRVWETASTNPLVTFQGHTDWVRSVTFSPDGSKIASGSDDQTVRLWEVATGRCLKILRGHEGRVYSVAFSPDGSTLVSGSEDQTLRLWEVSSGRCLNILQGHEDRVRAVVFSPDGSTLVSGSEDQTLRLWEVSSGRCLNILQGHTSKVRTVAFSPDGHMIASGSRDQTICLWEAGTGRRLNTLRNHTDGVWTVAFSPDGKVIASGGHDQTVRLWEVQSGQCLKTLQGHVDLIWSVGFSPDGKILASGSDDQVVRLWDIKSGKCLTTLQGHSNRVWSVAFSPDGKTLASSSDDQTIRLWKVDSGQPIATLQGHSNRVRSITFSPDGKTLASGSDDQTIRLWEIDSGQPIAILEGDTNGMSVAFSPDGRIIASGSEDQTVRLWNVKTGQYSNSLQGHSNRIRSVAFSPDGHMIASGSEDQTIRLWEISTGQCLNILEGHTNGVWTVAFSPKGNIVASGGHDQTVRLWEVSSGQCLQILRGHSDWVYSVVFSPDGSLVASGGIDGKINLWNVETGHHLKTLRSPRPYEGMDITDVRGLSVAQKAMLKTLGAVEY